MVSIDELWLVDFGTPYPGEPAARRPAIVLGPPEWFGTDFPLVIVAPLTTSHRGLSLHVEVPASTQTGLSRDSYVQCELLRAINTKRLLHRLGAVGADTSWQVGEIVKTLLNH